MLLIEWTGREILQRSQLMIWFYCKCETFHEEPFCDLLGHNSQMPYIHSRFLNMEESLNFIRSPHMWYLYHRFLCPAVLCMPAFTSEKIEEESTLLYSFVANKYHFWLSKELIVFSFLDFAAAARILAMCVAQSGLCSN